MSRLQLLQRERRKDLDTGRCGAGVGLRGIAEMSEVDSRAVGRGLTGESRQRIAGVDGG